MRGAPAGGRRGDARQADHARVRLRHPVPRPPLPAGAQPVGPRAHARRLRRAARAPRSRPASPSARSARTRAARSAAPPRSAASSGLKPTYGRCSRAGVLTLSWTLDHTGPMARTVEDCAPCCRPLAGYDPADPASSREPVDDYTAPLGRGVRGLRVGVPREYFFEGRRPRGRESVRAGLATLRQLGADVRDVEIPSIEAAPALPGDPARRGVRLPRARPARAPRALRRRACASGSGRGLFTGSRVRAGAASALRRSADMRRVLAGVDLLVTPTTPDAGRALRRGATIRITIRRAATWRPST